MLSVFKTTCKTAGYKTYDSNNRVERIEGPSISDVVFVGMDRLYTANIYVGKYLFQAISKYVLKVIKILELKLLVFDCYLFYLPQNYL